MKKVKTGSLLAGFSLTWAAMAFPEKAIFVVAHIPFTIVVLAFLSPVFFVCWLTKG